MNINKIHDHVNNSLGQACQNLSIRYVESNTGYRIINAVGGRLCGVVLKPLARIIDVVKHIFYVLTHVVFGPFASLMHQTLGRYKTLSPQAYFFTHGMTHLALANMFLIEVIPSLSNLIDPRVFKPAEGVVAAKTDKKDVAEIALDKKDVDDTKKQINSISEENQTQKIDVQQPHPTQLESKFQQLQERLDKLENTPPPLLPRDNLPSGDHAPSPNTNPSQTRPLPPPPAGRMPPNTPTQKTEKFQLESDPIPPAPQLPPSVMKKGVDDDQTPKINPPTGFQGVLEGIRSRKAQAKPPIPNFVSPDNVSGNVTQHSVSATNAELTADKPKSLPLALSQMLSDIDIDPTEFYNYNKDQLLWVEKLTHHFQNPDPTNPYVCSKKELEFAEVNRVAASNLTTKVEAAIVNLRELSQYNNHQLLLLTDDDSVDYMNTTRGKLAWDADDPEKRIDIIAEKFGRLLRTYTYIRVQVEKAKNKEKSVALSPDKALETTDNQKKVEEANQFEERFENLRNLFLANWENIIIKGTRGAQSRRTQLIRDLQNLVKYEHGQPNIATVNYTDLLKCLDIMQEKYSDKFKDENGLMTGVKNELNPTSSAEDDMSEFNKIKWSEIGDEEDMSFADLINLLGDLYPVH